jgi:hypothetical protein
METEMTFKGETVKESVEVSGSDGNRLVVGYKERADVEIRRRQECNWRLGQGGTAIDFPPRFYTTQYHNDPMSLPVTGAKGGANMAYLAISRRRDRGK